MYAPPQQFYVPVAVRVAWLRPCMPANLVVRVNESRSSDGAASHAPDDAHWQCTPKL